MGLSPTLSILPPYFIDYFYYIVTCIVLNIINSVVVFFQSYEDARVAQAAEDLSIAQDEIDALHSQLREKDKQLRAEIRHSDRSQQTISEYM